MRDNYTLLSAAGIETVAAVTGFALLELARNPGLRALLRENPDQLGAFVEESVRISCPVESVLRYTTQEVEIGGATLPAGSHVGLGLRAANIEDGDQMTVIDGKVRRHRHWGFGGGPHRCFGMHLARLEVGALVAEWLKRIPEFEPTPDFTPEYVNTPGSSRLSAVPLRWDT
jgi:cytochrome P450